MPAVRYLQLCFDRELPPAQIRYFRAAVIEKSKRQGTLMHNHKGEKGYYYRYPLVQYKLHYGKACIICLNEGVEEIHYLLTASDLDLKIGYRTYTFGIENLRVNMFRVQVWQHMFNYSIINWLGLNDERYKEFTSLESDPLAQKQLLEKTLKGNLLSFAKGIGWHVEERLEVQISDIKHIRRLEFKNARRLSFDLNFQTNVSLPDYLGLGKGASTGFGVVRRYRKPKPEEENEN